MEKGKTLLLLLALYSNLFSTHIEWDIARFGFKKISDSPEIYIAEGFLNDNECSYIIEKARHKLIRSGVVDPNSTKSTLASARTSYGTYLTDVGDPIIQGIRKRIEAVTMIPDHNGESLQVLNYAIGAEYKPHFDYFDPKTPGGLHHFNRGGQRVATVLLYLNSPEGGGETFFPKAPLKVRALKGRAALFYNVSDNGNPNPKSMHGGEPVLAGEKWIATLWLHEREFH